MAGERIASIMLRAGKDAIPSTEKTDLVYGRVVSTNPLKIQLAKESKITLTESFLILTKLCKEMKIKLADGPEVTLWDGLSVGDSVLMLRVLKGSKFIVLQKEGD